jgi:hypothetical protein
VETTPSEQKVVLIGASYLGYCRDHFCQSGFEVINLTVPGWVASPENVSAVMEQLQENGIWNATWSLTPLATQPSVLNNLTGAPPSLSKVEGNTTWLVM